MAEHESPKHKYLNVLGTHHVEKFLNGGRTLASVLSKNIAVKEDFSARYGGRFVKVRDYYASMKSAVTIQMSHRLCRSLLLLSKRLRKTRKSEGWP
jgi:hypothetical protein